MAKLQELGQDYKDIDERDIYINRGDVFTGELISDLEDASGSDLPTTGFTVKMDVIDNTGRRQLRCTTSNNKLITSSNKITLSLDKSDTEGLTDRAYYYDLRIERTGENPWYALKGTIYVSKRITEE